MTQFGNNDKSYPAEMRTQLWPLCCGVKIISGFKAVGNFDPKELVAKITETCDKYTPDHQVYGGETINPALTMLTLNAGQMQSKAIMEAVAAAGFTQFAKGTGRNKEQGFFYRDTSGNFQLINNDGAKGSC